MYVLFTYKFHTTHYLFTIIKHRTFHVNISSALHCQELPQRNEW